MTHSQALQSSYEESLEELPIVYLAHSLERLELPIQRGQVHEKQEKQARVPKE